MAEIWAELVRDLKAADVPIKQIDAHAIAMAARCLDGVEQAEAITNDAEAKVADRIAALKLKATFGKDLIQWLQLICATPPARARIGLKSAPKKKPGVLEQLLAAKHGRT